ncbi:hypothetical protein [Prevotella pallens]
MFAILFQFVSSIISRPLAAVGADLSCPHIRKHQKMTNEYAHTMK